MSVAEIRESSLTVHEPLSIHSSARHLRMIEISTAFVESRIGHPGRAARRRISQIPVTNNGLKKTEAEQKSDHLHDEDSDTRQRRHLNL